jgi:RHS repeat-associated protein
MACYTDLARNGWLKMALCLQEQSKLQKHRSGEYSGDYNELLYLRARYYAPGMGRFLTKDAWEGDYNSPLTLNRWNYVTGNPINYTDPSGMNPLIPCPDKDNPECTSKVRELKGEAIRIKDEVTNGNLLPVEGFAQFLDATMLKFDNDLWATMWAATLVINGFDADADITRPLWWQAYSDTHLGNEYWIQYNWLPYRQAICSITVKNWACSERGDWKKEYWDKTANQAYHGWYFAAEAFFDAPGVANFANWYHEIYQGDGFDAISPDPNVPPPASGTTAQDHALSLKMIELGEMLSIHYIDTNWYSSCPPNPPTPLHRQYMSPGAWIRANLKDHSHRGR